MTNPHYDILIIGAGLSGIGAACHLTEKCPNKSYAILERRNALGGTWDLFRYPGVRSDSDMYTLGYHFNPWTEPKVLADGPAIKNYIRETAAKFNILDKIQYGLKIIKASWSSAASQWTLTAEHEATGEQRQFTCNFLEMCTGYYNYDTGYMPDFPGIKNFKGQVIHPQHWPEDLDYSGKRVVVIGSGATAVTVVPAMTDKAAHVTMLQRSPSYVISLPAIDKLAIWTQKILPKKWAYWLTRLRNLAIQKWLYNSSKKHPERMRRFFLSGVRKQMGPDYDMTHFKPNYNPWDERVCAVPDADLFHAIKSGKASVATDHIETFTETGIQLRSGASLDADIVITATGLDLQLMGGMAVDIDGQTRDTHDIMTYKAVLIQDVPNAAILFGYTNAPWTLKADIAAAYVCRLLNHMDKTGHKVVTPRDEEGCAIEDVSVLDAMKSGYVKRAAPTLPRQGNKMPWQVLNDYKRDKQAMFKEPLEDEYLVFEG